MHIAEKVLEEYGLKWQSEEDTNDIGQLIKEKAEKRGETTFLETMDYHGRIVLQDGSRFIEKMGLSPKYKTFPKWFYDFVMFELFFGRRTNSLRANCMLSNTNVDNIISKKLTREESFFTERYPEYQLKRVFNAEEAKTDAAERMRVEWDQFYQDLNQNEGMAELFWILSVRVEKEGATK